MRGRLLGLVLGALLGLVGCQSAEVRTRPPKPPEDYTPPPEQDLRFSQPPEFPKETLNKDNLIRPKDPTDPTAGPGAGGAGGPGARFSTGAMPHY
jgi:hypothetical protein